MRNPFEHEKQEDIGLDMTPSRSRGRIPYATEPVEHEKPIVYHGSCKGRKVVEPPPVRSSIPRAKHYTRAQNDSHVSIHIGGGSPRRCIVKVPQNSYNHNKAEMNNSLLSSRLAPFNKNRTQVTKYVMDRANTPRSTSGRVAYVSRDGALEGELFTYDKDEMVIFDDNDEVLNMFDGGETYTIILSPEDPGCDLQTLVKRFMQELYPAHSDTMPAHWVAGIHGNTDHKHAHIIISSYGKDGKDARLHYDYIKSKQLFRDTCRVATEIMGPRSWAEEAEAERKKKDRMRYLYIDDCMFQELTPGDKEGEACFALYSIEDKGLRSKASRRLNALKAYRLAEKDVGRGRGHWIFKDNALEVLYRKEFEKTFDIEAGEMKEMVSDLGKTEPYHGRILESANSWDGKSMLFLIKDKAGVIHMHRESVVRRFENMMSRSEKESGKKKDTTYRYIVDEDRKTTYESLSDVELIKRKKAVSILLKDAGRKRGGRH